ncbi:unnamed protein product [Peronospora farinosa]|uniref:Uncharacterized protein n=1 Tax=Peronospora farinosa TaxID=134698 RepID=A0AAV0UYP8_9STRA|nr:unnamed protein product [Peronospora farinosa]
MQMPQQASNSRDSSFFFLPTVAATTASNSSIRICPFKRHQVESVLVSSSTPRRQSTTFFTIEVFTTASTIRSTRFHDTCSKFNHDSDKDTRKPAYQVDRTLADFKNLRRALCHSSRLAHRYVSCEYCKEIIRYLNMRDKQFGSSTLRILAGRDKLKRSLQEFMDVVLGILIHSECSEGTPWCSGQVQSHQLMRQFLLPRASDS